VGSVLALPPAAGPGDDGAARQRLDEVYRRPIFVHLDETRSPSLLASIFDAVRRLLGAAGGALGPVWSWLLGALLLAAVLLTAFRLVRGASAGRRRVLSEERRTAGADSEAEWSAALAAAARGDHREAVRRAFRSALLSIARRGRLQVEASWTTRELLARAAADPDLIADLAPAAVAFDRAWYSGAPVGEADWLHVHDHCAALRRIAPSPAQVAA
jgi:Domain of unknown function (DUF4129)